MNLRHRLLGTPGDRLCDELEDVTVLPCELGALTQRAEERQDHRRDGGIRALGLSAEPLAVERRVGMDEDERVRGRDLAKPAFHIREEAGP